MNFEQDGSFENALRRALQRESPAAGFADRVRGRIDKRRNQKLTRYWLAAAAMLALSVGAGNAVHDYQVQRHAEATRAGQELVIALKITSSKLHTTHRMIRRMTNAT